MSTRNDPLLDESVEGTDRLSFAQGMLLDAKDFTDEQTYHRSRLSRSLRHLFGTGTIVGLRVEWDADEEEIVVSPGLALDNLGRVIELPGRVCVSIERWYAAQLPADRRTSWLDNGTREVLVADVFIRFKACERGKTPAFRTGPFDALDAVTASRLRDAYEVGLVLRPEADDVRTGARPALPVPGWPQAFTAFFAQSGAARLQAIQALHTRDVDLVRREPPALPEHLLPRERQNVLSDPTRDRDPTDVGRDPTSVLLARVEIPITGAPPNPDTDPVLDADQPPAIDNLLRRFVYAPSILIGL